MRKLFLFLVCSSGVIFSAKSQDRQFMNVYQSNVLAKGAKDIEYFTTYGSGRDYFYKGIKQRLELETGLGYNIQTAFYLNLEHSASGIKGDSTGIINSEIGASFSNEWKFKISDPIANPVGFAAYAELTISPMEIELEEKIIFDKKINNHLLAFNITGEHGFEYEFENSESELEADHKLEFQLGYMYNFSPKLGIGIEATNHNKFTEADGWKFSALYAGPSIYLNGEHFFVILNFMPQLRNLHKKDGEISDLTFDGNEKFRAKLMFGLNF